jgi:hypothetical protein
MGMNKERNFPDRVHCDSVEIEKMRFGQLGFDKKIEVGSVDYEAVIKALMIGNNCYLDLLIISEVKQRSTSDLMLLDIHERKIDGEIEKIIEMKGGNQIFADKFRKICRYIMSDLENTSSIMLSYRFVLLERKIKEADGRTNLV